MSFSKFSRLWTSAAALVLLPLSGCTCGLPPVESSREVRRAQGAGMFYPESPEDIAREARELFAKAADLKDGAAAKEPQKQDSGKAERAAPMVLAPHAAWFFSGRVAAAAIRHLPDDFRRVFIIASNHNAEADFRGVSVERARTFELPGFSLAVNQDAVSNLLSQKLFSDVPKAHEAFVIEVELPLLREAAHQRGIERFEIVPLIVGRLSRDEAREAAAALNEVMNRPGDVLLVSLDLSHYHSDADARSLDAFALKSLAEMDADAIAHAETDGTQMLLMVNELAALRGLSPRVLAYANSSEAPEGETDRVVGYGAVAYEKDPLALSDSEKSALLNLARSSVEAHVLNGAKSAAPDDLIRRFPRLARRQSAFVTLTKGDDLRGCMGSLDGSVPLAREVADNALSAALSDPRFGPVAKDELPSLTYSISVLSAPAEANLFHPENWTPEMSDADKYGPGLRRLADERPGVVLRRGLRAATLLPVVWKQLPDPVHFLDALCGKLGGGYGDDCWMDKDAAFELYGAVDFGEETDKKK